MNHPIQTLKDGNIIKHSNDFRNNEDVIVAFDKDIIFFNKDLLEAYNVLSKFNKFNFTKKVEFDGLIYCEFDMSLFEKDSSGNYVRNELISSEGNNIIVCYADEAALLFGFGNAQDLINDCRRRETLYNNGNYNQGILAEFGVTNISDVIPFSGNMTFRAIHYNNTDPNYDGDLVIKCETSNRTFYVSTGFFEPKDYPHYFY